MTQWLTVKEIYIQFIVATNTSNELDKMLIIRLYYFQYL